MGETTRGRNDLWAKRLSINRCVGLFTFSQQNKPTSTEFGVGRCQDNFMENNKIIYHLFGVLCK